MPNKPVLSETIEISGTLVKCSPEYKKLHDEYRSYDNLYPSYDEMPDTIVQKLTKLATDMMYLDFDGHLEES